MGKFLGAIIGLVQIGVGIATSNPALIASGAATLATAAVALIFAPKAPKPQSTETQLRSPTPPRVKGYGRRRTAGALVLWTTASDGATVDVAAYFDGQISAVHKAYLNDDLVTITSGVVQEMSDGAYAGDAVKAGFNLGLPSETAHAAVVAKMPGIWTNDHRGDGVVTGYLIKEPVTSKKYLEIYPQGDNVQLSLVLDMHLCFDPREPSHDIEDDTTWAYTENPVLMLLHYLVVELGYDYTTKILPREQMWIDAANVCEESYNLDAGGTEDRYSAAILYDSTASPSEVISTILETFDGWYAPDSDGVIAIYAGRYVAPTVSIGASEIVSYSHQSFVKDEDYINELIVKYYSDAHDYKQVEAQPWRDDGDISSRGRKNSAPFEPQTRSFTQNRRLAKRNMARTNASDRGQVTTNIAGRSALGQRYINLEIVEAGVTQFSGVAEITSVTKNMDTGGVTFDWIKADQNIDVWNPATEDGYGAPVGSIPTPAPITTPTISSTTAQLDGTGTNARIQVNGSGPDRSDLTWFLRWRVTSGTVWNEQQYTDIVPGLSVTLLSNIVPVNVSIDVQIAYSIGDGRVSDWSTTSTISTSTAALAPAPPSEFSVTGSAGEANAAWRNPNSSNFKSVRLYRHTSDDFSGASQVGSDIEGALGELKALTDSGLSSDTYYYWITSVSLSDIESSETASGAVVVS